MAMAGPSTRFIYLTPSFSLGSPPSISSLALGSSCLATLELLGAEARTSDVGWPMAGAGCMVHLGWGVGLGIEPGGGLWMDGQKCGGQRVASGSAGGGRTAEVRAGGARSMQGYAGVSTNWDWDGWDWGIGDQI
jgi:hypothetical protein